MSLKIGFGRDSADRRGPAPREPDGRALQPDPRSTRPRALFGWLIPSLVLCVIAGAGGFIAFQALGKGQIVGFAFGIIVCVACLTMGISRIVSRMLGLDNRRKPHVGDRSWKLNDRDP